MSKGRGRKIRRRKNEKKGRMFALQSVKGRGRKVMRDGEL